MSATVLTNTVALTTTAVRVDTDAIDYDVAAPFKITNNGPNVIRVGPSTITATSGGQRVHVGQVWSQVLKADSAQVWAVSTEGTSSAKTVQAAIFSDTLDTGIFLTRSDASGTYVQFVSASADTSGVTDTAKIQAILNAAGKCVLGAGTFYVKNLQMVTGSTLAGSGRGATTLLLPTGAASGDAVIQSAPGLIFRKDTSVTLTNGSNVVGDTAAIALDAGKACAATGFTAPAFVGVVTPGVGFTVVDGSNAAVNFSGSTGSSYSINVGEGVGVQTCPHLFTISDLTIDGNSVGGNTLGYGLRLYAYAYEVRNVIVQSCRQNGIYSEWGTGGLTAPADNMEAHLTNIVVHRSGTGGGSTTLANIPGDADGICWNGPHDSQWTNIVASVNGNVGGSVGNNVSVTGNGFGLNINNAHFWGANSQNALYNEQTIYVIGAQLEGSIVSQWNIGQVGTTGTGVTCFAPQNSGTYGILIGNAVRANVKDCQIEAVVNSHIAGAIHFYSSAASAGGNIFKITASQASGTVESGTGSALDTKFYQVSGGGTGALTSFGTTTANNLAAGVFSTDAANVSQLDLHDKLMAPANTIAETYPRSQLRGDIQTLISGDLYLSAIPLVEGVPIGHLNFTSSTTPGAALLNWWFALFDSSLNMLAITADQGSAGWGSSTEKSLAIATTAAGGATTFTPTYTGLHYLGIMIKVTTTVPTMISWAGSVTVNAFPPYRAGISNTGQSTPPAFPFQATALSAIGGSITYGRVLA